MLMFGRMHEKGAFFCLAAQIVLQFPTENIDFTANIQFAHFYIEFYRFYNTFTNAAKFVIHFHCFFLFGSFSLWLDFWFLIFGQLVFRRNIQTRILSGMECRQSVASCTVDSSPHETDHLSVCIIQTNKPDCYWLSQNPFNQHMNHLQFPHKAN